ncbi:hypothetical protein CYMTET_36024 [Cymbomonas tetramitiformis]|uniref:Demethylmenaquinone methyltransferase n=1 Tax=Cymbomonas tetramitiformis TaxID=36881 RepID=A0AAE0F820_9CHLO|nr:hypothetical protein CYMTET_36024 [Cymbomonas tetramitiformis]
MVKFGECSAEEGFKLKGKQKLEFVTELFDRIAVQYDTINLFISLGQTTIWRILALGWLHTYFKPGSKVLDVGCGTGWVSWFLHRRYPNLNLQVEAMDCSQQMLQEAQRLYPKYTFTHGDVCALPYSDGAFDMVTTVYTLRNFPDLYSGLEEMVRVTAPRGHIVILDAFPTGGLMQFVLKVWLSYIMPYIAGMFIEQKPYNYLANSIQSTVPSSEVASILTQLGCTGSMLQTRYSFGAAVRLIAQKNA